MSLFHYTEALTNTRGDSLVGYFARVIDPTTLAVVPIYADRNATGIDTVSGVANMAKSDTDGMLSFYFEMGTYHLDIYGTDATTFIKRISDLAMAGDITDDAQAALDDAEAAAAAAAASATASATSASGSATSATSASTSATNAAASATSAANYAAAAANSSIAAGAYPNAAASNEIGMLSTTIKALRQSRRNSNTIRPVRIAPSAPSFARFVIAPFTTGD